jgi:hypothetical protein
MFTGHSEIVAFLLHRFNAGKPAALLRLLEFHIRKRKLFGRFVEFQTAIRLYGEGRATGPLKTAPRGTDRYRNGEIMTQYLVAIHHPDNYDPSREDEAMGRDIGVLNEEMIAAGVRTFAGGLLSASSAKSLRAQPDGKVLVTDGPYLETKEHIGGFWILEAADLDEALAWGRKAAVACRAPVEVRAFHSRIRRDGRS